MRLQAAEANLAETGKLIWKRRRGKASSNVKADQVDRGHWWAVWQQQFQAEGVSGWGVAPGSNEETGRCGKPDSDGLLVSVAMAWGTVTSLFAQKIRLRG